MKTNSTQSWSENSRWLYDAMASRFADNAGDYQTAIKQMSDVAEKSKQYEAFKYSFDLALDVMQLKVAKKNAQNWVAAYPQDSEAQLSLIRVELMQHNYEDAYSQIVKMLEGSSDSSLVSQISALLGYVSDDTQRLNLLTRLAERFPQNPYLYYSLGLMAKEQGQIVIALQAFSHALTLEPNWRQLDVMQAKVLSSVGRFSEAKAMLDTLRQKFPEDKTLLSAEVDILVDHYQWQEALTLLDKWILLDPKDSRLQELKAWLNSNAGNYSAAQKDYQELLDSDNLDADQFYFQLAQAAKNAKESNQAIAELRKISKTSNLYMLSHQQIGMLQFAQGDINEAQKTFSQLRELYPDYAMDMYIVEINQLDKWKKFELTKNLLQDVLRKFPTQVDVLYALAEHQTMIGDVKGAQQTYRKILKMDPANTDAINALGYLLLTHTDDKTQAKQLIEQALANYPSSPAVQDSYGWMLYLEGKPEEALLWMQRAYSGYRKEEIAAHYIEVLIKNNQQALAKEIYQSERAGQPDNQFLQAVGVKFGLN